MVIRSKDEFFAVVLPRAAKGYWRLDESPPTALHTAAPGGQAPSPSSPSVHAPPQLAARGNAPQRARPQPAPQQVWSLPVQPRPVRSGGGEPRTSSSAVPQQLRAEQNELDRLEGREAVDGGGCSSRTRGAAGFGGDRCTGNTDATLQDERRQAERAQGAPDGGLVSKGDEVSVVVSCGGAGALIASGSEVMEVRPDGDFYVRPCFSCDEAPEKERLQRGSVLVHAADRGKTWCWVSGEFPPNFRLYSP